MRVRWREGEVRGHERDPRVAEGKPLELGLEGQEVCVTQGCQLEGTEHAHESRQRGERAEGGGGVGGKAEAKWPLRGWAAGEAGPAEGGRAGDQGWASPEGDGGAAASGVGRGRLEGCSAIEEGEVGKVGGTGLRPAGQWGRAGG